MAKVTPRAELTSLLSALDELRSLADADLILKRAIELARDRIGLRRAGVFLLDGSRNLMLGTWGMDLSCSVVDEHQIGYRLVGSDREALSRSEQEEARFTIFENCAIIEHEGDQVRVGGRGWVAKTPIRSANEPIGMMFNDAALTGDGVDEVKQTYVAVLCSMLGTVLGPMRGCLSPPSASPRQRLVASVVEMLHQNPALKSKELAEKLDIELSHLARVFKLLMGVPLVDYRNRLRLARFEALTYDGRSNLLDAALEAGFGSYAQFHRVFRAQLKASPRAYLHGESRRVQSPGRTSK